MNNMKYRKREYLPLKIRDRKNRKIAEQGQTSWVLGLFLILFLAIVLTMQLQLALYSASARYLEDALALSNLASAVIDVQEYGRTHRVLITDPWQAYDRYCAAVKENLGLNDDYEAANHKLISGQVEILNYTIYNVAGTSLLFPGVGKKWRWADTGMAGKTWGGKNAKGTAHRENRCVQ